MRVAFALSFGLALIACSGATPASDAQSPSAAPTQSVTPIATDSGSPIEREPATSKMRLIRFERPAVEVEIEADRVANSDFNGYYQAVYLSDGSGFRVVDASAPYPSTQAEAESQARVYGSVEQRTEQLPDGFFVLGRTKRQPRRVLLVIRRIGELQVLCDASGETDEAVESLLQLCKALRPIRN
jgi:hypothetical protein